MSPSPASAQASAEWEQAWAALECPFTVSQLQDMIWLQMKHHADLFLYSAGQPADDRFSKRLAFEQWLYRTGRLYEAKAA